MCGVSMTTTDSITIIDLRPALNILYEKINYITFYTHYEPSPTSISNKSVFYPFSSAFSQYIERSGLCTNSSNNVINDDIVLIVPRCSLW